MSLIAIRKLFLDTTGRYDLVDSVTYANTGADTYIRAGQRWLDEAFYIRQNYGRRFTMEVAGAWNNSGLHCRSITEVWMSTATAKWQLEKIDLAAMILRWPANPSTMSRGAPRVYAVTNRRSHGADLPGATVVDWWGNYLTTQPYDYWDQNGIIWRPPLDVDTMVEVHGRFNQPALTADQAQNYWTEDKPMALLWAACRVLEISYRNTTGAREWEQAIRAEMQPTEWEFAEQQAAGITGFEG